MIVCNPLRISLLLVGAQVCDPLIYCVWHVIFGRLWNNPTWLQNVSSNICKKIASSHYSFCTFDVQVFFCRCSLCDPLISCVWHVTFGWLSTNNPAWLQYVSSNIFKKVASSHFSFCGFVVQLLFVGAEHRQAKDYYAKDYKRSCLGSEIKGRNSWNLTTCTNTQNRLKVRTVSRIWQKRNKNTPYALSNEKE